MVRAEDAGIGVEVALPEFVAEHDDGLRILTVDCVGGMEAAAERGRDAEEVEAVGGEIDALDVFGEIAAGDGEVPVIGP